jgi:hypothetical protein
VEPGYRANPAAATETFSHSQETAQAGYYEDTLGNGVTVKLTDSTGPGSGRSPSRRARRRTCC